MTINLTSEYPAFVAQRFTNRAAGAEGILHSAVGMVGELLELGGAGTRPHTIEELGDFEFYRCAAYRVLGLAWTMTDPQAAETPGGWAYVYPSFLHGCESFLDAAKKCWVYERPVSVVDFQSPLWVIESCLRKAYIIFGLDRGMVLQANMDKLLKRYPKGYTNELAAKRLDKVQS